MTNIIITGVSELGADLYKNLSKKNVTITVLGRNAPTNIRKKDNIYNIDFSKKVNFKYDVLKNISKVIFLSNAGVIDPICSITKISEKQLKLNNNVNFISPFIIAAELTRVTKIKNILLHIVNISLGAANRAIPQWSAYCTRKASIKIALDCIVMEHKYVTLKHINPGVLDTNMQVKIRSNERKLSPETQYVTNLYKNGLLIKPDVAALKIIKSIEKNLL